MHNFLAQFRNSLTRSETYAKPEGNRAGKAFAYMAVLVVLIALAKAVAFGFAFTPILNQMRIVANDALEKFPPDLILTFEKGSLSMNKPSPYIIPWQQTGGKVSEHKNLIVIDTDKTLDFKAFKDYDTYIFAARDGYMSYGERGSIKADSFRNFPDYKLSRSSLEPFRIKFESIIDNFSALGVVVLTILVWVFLSIANYAGAVILALLGVLITLLVTRIKGYDLSFSQLLALSLYAYTFVALLGLVRVFSPFPSWISFVVFVVILSSFVTRKPTSPVSSSEAPAPQA